MQAGGQVQAKDLEGGRGADCVLPYTTPHQHTADKDKDMDMDMEWRP